ncbi:DEKNAAC103257 [Brettanomyces naardenensis]|uniref:DEKNAAC103257 n=1 Tax=Brettanomyces naardenensis TaxID=13370 RepID=A0A448YMV1_BRENA|nr:DEKNAAC103257 [Brettanomyces naardenensis]
MFGIKKGLNRFKHLPKLSLNKASYCDTLILDATDDNDWGPTSVELNELSHLSFKAKSLSIICKRLIRRLNSSNPVQVLKALTVVYFLLQTGSGEFIQWLYSQKYLMRSLIEYQVDTRRGEALSRACSNVRQKATEISRLLDDKDLLLAKREEFKSMRLNMKLPTPRSSLDLPPLLSTPSSPITGSGGFLERKTRSLDIYNRGDVMDGVYEALNNLPQPSRQGSLENEGKVVFTSNRLPDFSRALANQGTRSKLSNIVEIDEEDTGIRPTLRSRMGVPVANGANNCK